jgi:preprotein translocase subunit Sec63
MTAAFDPFEVLGIRPNSTREQIRTAYREQVARYHPDKHRGNPLEDLAAAKLVEINRAYEILTDDAKRATYEATGSSNRAPAPPTSPTVTRPRSDTSSPAGKLVRSLGWIVALIFFLRFGLVLGGQAVAILRGFVLGVLGLLRASPIFAIAVIGALALGGLLLRSRKRQG